MLCICAQIWQKMVPLMPGYLDAGNGCDNIGHLGSHQAGWRGQLSNDGLLDLLTELHGKLYPIILVLLVPRSVHYKVLEDNAGHLPGTNLE
jgi:hypothetical protein